MARTGVAARRQMDLLTKIRIEYGKGACSRTGGRRFFLVVEGETVQ